MELRFSGEVVYWRGPAPYLFVRLPAGTATEIGTIAAQVSYGWGCIPVTATIGGVDFATALMPREGSYMLPLKVALRRQFPALAPGDTVEVILEIAEQRR